MLIPYGTEFPVETSVPFRLLKVHYKESLRQGTVKLLRELSKRGCEIWVYTTSARDAPYLLTWFRLLGIRLGGVVNCHRHEKEVRAAGYPPCSKYPPAFGIDLLIDNSEGVAMEGKRYGFDVVCVSPAREDWAEYILDEVKKRLG